MWMFEIHSTSRNDEGKSGKRKLWMRTQGGFTIHSRQAVSSNKVDNKQQEFNKLFASDKNNESFETKTFEQIYSNYS